MSTRCHAKITIEVFVDMSPDIAKGQPSLSDIVRDAYGPLIADHLAASNVEGMPVQAVIVTSYGKLVAERRNLIAPQSERPKPLRRGAMDRARKAVKEARNG